jgi:hypothetical protein
MVVACMDSYNRLDATQANIFNKEAIFYIGFRIWTNPHHAFYHVL